MSEFERKREQEIAERCEEIPRSYRADYRKAMEGKSLRAAVNSACRECVVWKIKEVRHCTNRLCPLYMVRPYQKGSRNNQDGHSGGRRTAKASACGRWLP